MKYLALATFQDGLNVAIRTEEIDLKDCDPLDEMETVIEKICMGEEYVMSRPHLLDLFLFKSAQNYGSPPEEVAHWTPGFDD